MTAPDLDIALRAHADSLAIVSDAIRNAADVLQAGGAPTAVVATLSLSALNAASAALGLARRCGQIEAMGVTP